MIFSQKPTYAAARTVAASIEAYFARLSEGAIQKAGKPLALARPQQVIELILDNCFWASLRREEGKSPKVSAAYLDPHQT